MAEQPDDLGGMLSQDELDALLAAASAEPQNEEANPWAEDEAAFAADPAPTPSAPAGGTPMGGAGSVVDLPSFDAPAAARSYAAPGPEPVGMARVRDIPLEVTVELGRTRLLIRDILDLNSGSIIELDKIAGEPVDLYANGLLVARGEVIVIDDNFGVRVTEIITASERAQGKGHDLLG